MMFVLWSSATVAAQYSPSKGTCCIAGLADPPCSCLNTRQLCSIAYHKRMCTTPPPLDEVEFTQVRALATRQPSSSPCKWDQTDVLMKASSLGEERPLIRSFVRSWVTFMECFPAFHVVSDVAENASSFRGLFRAVPNVTYHSLSYPFQIDFFYNIQWPMLWADNFTTARHVMILDADSPLVRPPRCHQLFNGQGVPVWRSWQARLWWVQVSDQIVGGLVRARNQTVHKTAGHLDAWREGNDFMTFFPVVIPRAALPATRQFLSDACAAGVLDGPTNPGHSPERRFQGLQNGSVLRAQGACGDFDRVFMTLGRPSYADLIGKITLFLTPPHAAPLIDWQQCSPLARPGSRNSACLDFAPVTEHVKHPLMGSANGFHPEWPATRRIAAEMMERLVSEGLAFANSGGNLSLLPKSFLFYNISRPEGRVSKIAHSVLRADASGQLCGVLQPTAAAGGLSMSL